MKTSELSQLGGQTEVCLTGNQALLTASTTSTAHSPAAPSTTTTVEADLAALAPPAPKRKRGAQRPSKRARLLVADDSPEVRKWLASLFEGEGYEVILASDGQEALDCYQPGLIDVVLLDLDMPVKSGWDVFEEIVSRNGNQAIILLTEEMRTVNLAGAGQIPGVAAKPLKPGALLDAVNDALREPTGHHQRTVDVQHSFARYTRPYEGPCSSLEAYEHGGLND